MFQNIVQENKEVLEVAVKGAPTDAGYDLIHIFVQCR